MLHFHTILLQLRNESGYKNKEDGACILYAEKGIDAFLVGEYKTTFIKRREYIEEKYESWPGLFQAAKKQIKSLAFIPHATEQLLLS